ncbi:FAD:protein FMN transferase [Cellvibrio sp. QJXJ]|uniref:FAD:protein FMN transferase n=1 Tax=Cellvibrio sp. QJXJ TaxID=2964606 RepID=UPI0021C33CD0|nr:FAD:protein FMN transferase [Cellvibrio sp. QJXJ]UUA71298.1 FAD:protein FMN transferase [Cellvibrio sp. QJXJ]
MKLIIFYVIFFSGSALAKWHSDAQDVMGTRVSLTFWLEDDAKAAIALAAVMAEMHRIDQHFSPYITSSELSRANQQAVLATADKPLVISPELTRLIDKSLYYSRLTDGAFDITFASLARYYDYRKRLTPSEAQRAALLPAINYRLIHLDKQQRTLWFEHPQLYIDLGGIAKGYAVDRGIAILRSYGVMHASLSAGGDSRVLGDKRGRPWLVGIKNPRADAVAISLPLDNVAVSTSGDYERYFIADSGERVHHIINPRTGKSTSGVNSVTIIGPQGFDTDPLSTSVFVMGPEKGLALINKLPGFDAVIITSQGKVLYSQGLENPQ